MQRNINKEIRHYQEDVFMGLTLRQLLCSIVAVGIAMAVYFALQNILDHETVSWVCIVAALPVAAVGFFEYDGMSFEKFLAAVYRSEVRCSGWKLWKAENRFAQAKSKKGVKPKTGNLPKQKMKKKKEKEPRCQA